jgi:hypothetical protein
MLLLRMFMAISMYTCDDDCWCMTIGSKKRSTFSRIDWFIIDLIWFFKKDAFKFDTYYTFEWRWKWLDRILLCCQIYFTWRSLNSMHIHSWIKCKKIQTYIMSLSHLIVSNKIMNKTKWANIDASNEELTSNNSSTVRQDCWRIFNGITFLFLLN